MKNLKMITFLVACILAFGCDKDDGSSQNPTGQDPNTFTENFGNEISRNFLGTVIDKNRNPIESVSITIGSLSALTDSNGVFIIQDAPVYERFGYVKAEKAGYISGSRAVVPSSGTNKVTMMLLEKTVVGTTSSGVTETITLTNGASVALAGEYITESGATYSGRVDIVMHHLDPIDENMADQMPGMLYAANAQNEEQMLKTFGMLAVELIGSNGEELNLAEGSTAEITVPLDATLLADAPGSIPLWYFDETYGYWVEEGEATLVGNAYVGTVSHFSFWNCDVSTDAVNLCVFVVDETGNPLSNMNVTITSLTFGATHGTSNEQGTVCGYVPGNETLSIKVEYEADSCEIQYNSVIGPYSEDTFIELIPSDLGELVDETIVGFFETCDGDPISNGYVIFEYLSQEIITPLNEGIFEIVTLRCSEDTNPFSIQAYDFDNVQTTDDLSYSFSTPSTNLGNIMSCNDIDQYITYQVSDHPEIIHFENIETYTEGDVLIITHQIMPGSTAIDFNLRIAGEHFNGLGTYSSEGLNTPSIFITFSDENGDRTNPMYFHGNIYVTSFGDIGEVINLNFNGELIDEDGLLDNENFTGSARIIREN